MALDLLYKHLHVLIVVLFQRVPECGAMFAALGCFFVMVLIAPQGVIFFRERVNQVMIPVFHNNYSRIYESNFNMRIRIFCLYSYIRDYSLRPFRFIILARNSENKFLNFFLGRLGIRKFPPDAGFFLSQKLSY